VEDQRDLAGLAVELDALDDGSKIFLRSKTSIMRAKSISERLRRSTL
jgi:hypothetical protein